MTKLLALAVALLAGCASDPYWHRDMPGYLPARIEINLVEDPRVLCGLPAARWGCAIRLRGAVNRPTALIYVRQDLPRDTLECVLQHEFRHALGYGHRGEWTGDCGNGERR